MKVNNEQNEGKLANIVLENIKDCKKRNVLYTPQSDYRNIVMLITDRLASLARQQNIKTLVERW